MWSVALTGGEHTPRIDDAKTAPLREFIEGARTVILGEKGRDDYWPAVIKDGHVVLPEGKKIAPKALKEALVNDDKLLVRAAQLILLVPFTTDTAWDEKHDLAREYALALGFSPTAVEDWKNAHDSQDAAREWCALRKLGREVLGEDPGDMLRRAVSHLAQGFAGLARFQSEIASFQKLAKRLEDMKNQTAGDPATEKKYMDLGNLAPGTLGRAFYDFYMDPPVERVFEFGAPRITVRPDHPSGDIVALEIAVRSRRVKDKYGRPWPMPGTVAWVPEELTAHHDVMHVLTGYDLDVPGEFEVAGFTAGASSQLCWASAMLGFMPPYRRGQEAFDVNRFIAAFKRGLATTRSLHPPEICECKNAGGCKKCWNWWNDRKKPLEQVRKELGIV